MRYWIRLWIMPERLTVQVEFLQVLTVSVNTTLEYYEPHRSLNLKPGKLMFVLAQVHNLSWQRGEFGHGFAVIIALKLYGEDVFFIRIVIQQLRDESMKLIGKAHYVAKNPICIRIVGKLHFKCIAGMKAYVLFLKHALIQATAINSMDLLC